MNPILEALTFPTRSETEIEPSTSCECLLCSEVFDLRESNDQILTHLLLIHKLVIADIKEIVDLKRYWAASVKDQVSNFTILYFTDI